ERGDTAGARVHQGGGQGEAQEPAQAHRGPGARGAAHGRGGGVLRGHPHPDQLLHRRLREGRLPRPQGPHGPLRQGGRHRRREGRRKDSRACRSRGAVQEEVL
ncbi:MAG: Repressor CsoR of the copZA operon, partial [uncultured Rubrobacteraceae bacterium]